MLPHILWVFLFSYALSKDSLSLVFIPQKCKGCSICHSLLRLLPCCLPLEKKTPILSSSIGFLLMSVLLLLVAFVSVLPAVDPFCPFLPSILLPYTNSCQSPLFSSRSIHLASKASCFSHALCGRFIPGGHSFLCVNYQTVCGSPALTIVPTTSSTLFSAYLVGSRLPTITLIHVLALWYVGSHSIFYSLTRGLPNYCHSVSTDVYTIPPLPHTHHSYCRAFLVAIHLLQGTGTRVFLSAISPLGSKMLEKKSHSLFCAIAWSRC